MRVTVFVFILTGAFTAPAQHVYGDSVWNWSKRCSQMVAQLEGADRTAANLILRALTLEIPPEFPNARLTAGRLLLPVLHDFGGVGDFQDEFWIGHQPGSIEYPDYFLIPRRLNDGTKRYVFWELGKQKILPSDLEGRASLPIEVPNDNGHWRLGFDAIERRLKNWELPPLMPRFPSVFAPYSPYLFEMLSAATKEIENANSILVLGSGAGTEAVSIAHNFKRSVDATDINLLAVANTKMAAKIYGLSDQVRAWMSDGFGTVFNSYDLILFNAPLPVRRPENPHIADEGGEILWRVLNRLQHHLNERGSLILMSTAQLPDHIGDKFLVRRLRSFTATGASLGVFQIRPRPRIE